MINVETIDLEEFLQSRGIPYSPPGSKNVSRHSVGISCPFCMDHPQTGDNHLGIRLDTKQWSCWICGAGKKKHFLSLVVKLENCSYRQAEELLKPFTHSDLSLISRPTDVDLRAFKGRLELPLESTEEILTPHKRYLESRNFDPEFLFYKYKLRCVGPISKRWKLSIIAPIYFNHRLVSFVSADITRKRDPKYKDLSPEESVLPVKHSIYNIDNAGNSILITEGLTDVWNIGDGAGALFTKKASSQQLKILSKFDRVFIMLDSDANKKIALNRLSPSEELAYDLAAFTETEIIELDYGDPAEMTADDVRHLRRELFGQ